MRLFYTIKFKIQIKRLFFRETKEKLSFKTNHIAGCYRAYSISYFSENSNIYQENRYIKKTIANFDKLLPHKKKLLIVCNKKAQISLKNWGKTRLSSKDMQILSKSRGMQILSTDRGKTLILSMDRPKTLILSKIR